MLVELYDPMDRDLQSLCDRLNEVFNEDDTPDELSQEAVEAIEELWEERDRLRALMGPHRQDPETGECRPDCWRSPASGEVK
jgi:hypothetical protein